jgi:hypothetical protein
MKASLLLLAALPAAAVAQTALQPVKIMPPVIVPGVAPSLIAPPPCLTNIIGEKGSAIIGEEGTNEIIGEKGSDAIIGEKGSGEIIGEEGSDAIIGEEGRVISDRWSASGFTTYKHVLVGRPGKRTLSLYGCSSAGGGETVAVYLAGADGERKTGWRHFVIATRNGNFREGTVTLPKPAQGETLSRLPIVVVVENASGKPHVGEYRLKITN